MKLARIRENSNFFRSQLQKMGFEVLGDNDSPVMPIMLYNPSKIPAFSRECLKQNVSELSSCAPSIHHQNPMGLHLFDRTHNYLNLGLAGLHFFPTREQKGVIFFFFAKNISMASRGRRRLDGQTESSSWFFIQVAVVTVAFPATPLLLARARICISASHTREDLIRALKVG